MMKRRLEKQKRNSVQIPAPVGTKQVSFNTPKTMGGYQTPKINKSKGVPQKQEVLYSDDSYKRLATNDTTRHDTFSEVISGYKNSSSHSVYLLNRKFKFREFINY